MPDTCASSNDRAAALRSVRRRTVVLGLVVGGLYFAAFAVQGEYVAGASGLGVVLAYVTATYALRDRSEAARLLATDPVDERQMAIVRNASAVTGSVLIVVLVIGMLVTVALDSQYRGVFVALCAAGGGVFGLSVFWFARRG